jgi:hypothetical protein
VPRVRAGVWSRLSQMSWDELRTRLRQEIGKRLDVARYAVAPYREGKERAADRAPDPTLPPASFFFSPAELPERIRLLQKHLPLEMEACIDEADEICGHRFRLLAYDNIEYGKEINWHLDAVHGKRVPLIPWYKINFLDFAVAGDHKVTWELNRHQHLVTLAKAWQLTHEDHYASEAIAQWYSWQRANPYPLGVNWASSLEVAFRSLSWLWLYHLLSASPALPANFESDLSRALALNGRHIERYLSTYFSPNTHLLGEALALVCLGTLCPQLPRAPRWKLQGWRILDQEAQHQVLPDGVYFEQSLYYHVYALDIFLHARLLAARNQVGVPPGFDEVIQKMLAVVQSLALAGPPDGFGDDDGGRLFNPRRNRPEHMTDPLSIGAAMFDDPSLRTSSTLTEEAIWLFGPHAINPQPRDARKRALAANHSFSHGGLYIAVDPDLSQQMILDAGPVGAGRAGHGHADALSVKLLFNHRPWLVDAGTFAYISDSNSSEDQRQIFRGTRAHNTLSVDGLDQANPEGPFGWTDLPRVLAESWIAGATFTFFSGSHNGYKRLPQPVGHRRFLFHLRNNFWLIRDVADGSGTHLLESSWHFAADLAVSSTENRFLASSPAENRPGRAHLALLPVPDPRWKCSLSAEHVSPAYGVKVHAPVLRCTASLLVPAEHAMLLIPSAETTPLVGKFQRLPARPSDAIPPAIYTYDLTGALHHMLFAPASREQTSPATWSFGPWRSDARFLYFCLQDRRVSHLVSCEGSFVHLDGKTVLSHNSPLQYLEWINRKGERWINSSDEGAADTFSVKAIEAEI